MQNQRSFSVGELWAFGTNSAALVGLLFGLAFLAEVFGEFADGLLFSIDDAVAVLLGLVGLIWFISRDNKYQRSVVPVVLIVLGLVTKLVWIMLESSHPDDVGDDIGGMIAYLIGSIVVVTFYFVAGRKQSLRSVGDL